MLIDINGTNVHVVREGSGTPLVIPSLAGTPIYERTFSPRLREYLTLVFVELRANRADPGEPDLTLDRVLDDLDAVRATLGYDRISVLGHSAHSILALAYAAQYPSHTDRVVVVGGPASTRPSTEMDMLHEAYWDTVASPERKQFQADLEAAYDPTLPRTPSEALIAQYVTNGPRTWYDPSFDCTPLWEGHDNLDLDLIMRFWGPDGMFQRFDSEVGLPGISCPVLIAMGAFDFLCPPILWAGLHQRLAHHTFHTFERSGHLPHVDEQDHFDEVLLKWMGVDPAG
ncbi:MAG TPA: alpha/beta hydrolase [Thermomicrobiales bacterium]|nr:alpha/beta hydrolase [Thermomicrobiales bacterium]